MSQAYSLLLHLTSKRTETSKKQLQKIEKKVGMEYQKAHNQE